ncbi:MAG TPA: HAD-IB family hydrolase [Bacteroidetes bacterium]|nr:HAD-IB family hydrolase [Bacteroidota bacterium]
MEKILKDPGFQKKLAAIAEQKGESFAQVNEEAATYLKELYTEQKPIANLIGVQTAQYILSRGYDKTIDVNPTEIKQVAKLMQKHPVAFVMTHKTYIDMLVLGVVLARHGLPLPYIFAGINMSFMGLGQLGRQTGAIFIRRSFRDNPVYKATLRHFIASIVSDKGHFMWAIEGTRSRTGKLVWPKMGILKYIMDAEQDSPQEVKYVPVSIVYDLIPDVKEMTREMRGKAKKAESLGWFLNYIKKMGEKLGRISLRFGEPVQVAAGQEVTTYEEDENEAAYKGHIPRFALELVHKINQITPVTTASLITIALLSKYALTKRGAESDVADLMKLIEGHKADALVDRGRPIGESVQYALNLLTGAGLIKQHGDSLHAKYTIQTEEYLPANYYANMAVHHLYRRAFIELALARLAVIKTEDTLHAFWEGIMQLRDLFKFEFFYPNKAQFCDEIEADLEQLDHRWQEVIADPEGDLKALLEKQKVLIAPVVLYTYLEAYSVVAHALQEWDRGHEFNEKAFLQNCIFLGGELQWQGRIQRIESVSKTFLQNGVRLAKNKGLIPSAKDPKTEAINAFLSTLDNMTESINILQKITLAKPVELNPAVPVEREIVPGSKTDAIVKTILEGEGGPHIGAFFDLDRTLIKGFSAKEFFQTRLFSGRMSSKEIVAQFAGALVYAFGNGNFAGLAAIGAQGVKGVDEKTFIEVGEEVYLKHLADEIYPEARALVAAHMAKGHTVAIVSAATPYQVEPIARDLCIEEVMCTRMEVHNGKFTGRIIEPACWGEGKAHAARELAEKHQLDLAKSYFYTDSAEDMPLLEIVGNPRPMNPDTKLSGIAFKNDWPVYRFNDETRPGVTGIVRTGLALGSLIPAALKGILAGLGAMSWDDGVNSMMASVGDLACKMAGIQVVVKGREHLWSQRPAVFLFNHQSNADLFIMAKLLRRDARGVAKQELKNMPIIGQMMQAAGVIFLDRSNREKAIEALKPAVEALKTGTSIIIAPEGTRSYDYKMGKFKKGAFHLAMQAGVPIVPIVIANAHDAMPRGKNVFRPTAVQVTVLPPILTKKWKVKDLNKHIKEVRGKYLEVLGQEDGSGMVAMPVLKLRD